MAGQYTFGKSEKLTEKKIIDGLFGPVTHFKQYPLRLNLLPIEENIKWDQPAKVLIIVGKRSFKRAVDRNYQKRLIRETFRIHKSELYEAMGNSKYALGIFRMGNTPLDYKELNEAMQLLLQKTIKHLKA
jgi:ribonuclease P protein component